MPYGNPFSHISNVKGIAVDLPFCRFRYVTVEGDSGKKTVSDSRAAVPPRSHAEIERRDTPVRRIEYVRPAQVTTLGADPLVSSASVIHELFFGRTAVDSPAPVSGERYPVPKEEAPHALDFFV